MMEGKRFPGLADHQAEHRKLTEKVVKFQQEFSQGKMGLSIALLTFLREWLLDHMAGTDKQYSKFLT